MERKLKLEIVIGLSLLVVASIYINLTYPNLVEGQANDISESLEMMFGDNYTTFAIIVNYAYELLPQTAQQIGLGAISTKLLILGFSPLLFTLIIALGKLSGQMIIYFASRFIFHFKKKNLGGLASANHYLHKYHFLAFLLPPWVGVVGDALMIIAGQQRINPIKILPILFVSDFLEAGKMVYWTMGQLEISDAVS